MMIFHAFVFDDEFKSETRLGPEFFQIEIPGPHLIDIGQCLPHSRNRRVEYALDYNRIR